MTHSVGYQSASILRKPNKLMNSGWNRDYTWAQQNGFLLTMVIQLLPLLSVQSASNRNQHYTPDMTPFPGVISLLSGSRLIILDHFQNGRDVLLLLEYTLTLDMNLLSQHTMLLSKLSSVELQNAFSTVMVFYIALLLIKECTSQQSKNSNGPMLMELISLIKFPNIKQLD